TRQQPEEASGEADRDDEDAESFETEEAAAPRAAPAGLPREDGQKLQTALRDLTECRRPVDMALDQGAEAHCWGAHGACSTIALGLSITGIRVRRNDALAKCRHGFPRRTVAAGAGPCPRRRAAAGRATSWPQRGDEQVLPVPYRRDVPRPASGSPRLGGRDPSHDRTRRAVDGG